MDASQFAKEAKHTHHHRAESHGQPPFSLGSRWDRGIVRAAEVDAQGMERWGAKHF